MHNMYDWARGKDPLTVLVLASLALFRVPAHLPNENGNREGLFVRNIRLCQLFALMFTDHFGDILVVIVRRQFAKALMFLEVIVAIHQLYVGPFSINNR